MQHVITSIIVGSFVGILYGLSVVTQGKALFSSKATSLSITRIALPVIRVTLTAVLLYYLLRSTALHPILILLSFILFFWMIILFAKASPHGKP